MIRPFFYKHFKYWLKKNQHRFIATPYIAKVTRSFFVVRFQECHGLISLEATKDGFYSVWSRYKRKDTHQAPNKTPEILTDWVGDFDTLIKKDALGRYYCDLCVKPKKYRSREELLSHHVYEAFLRWSNEFIRADTQIIFFPYETKIFPAEKEEDANKFIQRSKEAPIYIFKIKNNP